MGERAVPREETEASLQEAVRAILASSDSGELTAAGVAQLTATYDALAASITAELAAVAAGAGSGSAALGRMLHALLERLDHRPGEAQLFLLGILRAGREGARHHRAAQQRIGECVCAELSRRTAGAPVDRLQVEMLVGAVYQGLVRTVTLPQPSSLLAAEAELLQRAHALNPLLG